MEKPEKVSKELLEKILDKKINSVRLDPGSNAGDNYMSIMLSFDVQLADNEEKSLHLLAKCYPSNPARQEFLNRSNVFWNELSIYQKFLPELESFANKMDPEFKLPFPTFVGGKAINFSKLRESGDFLSFTNKKVFDNFDNYILMTDLRKTYGFRMADRQLGVDMNHISLVVKALAKFHAVCWAYKQHFELKSFDEKFNFVNHVLQPEDSAILALLMNGNIKLAAETIKNVIGDCDVVQGTLKLLNHIEQVLEASFIPKTAEEIFTMAHRIKPLIKSGEVSWRVLLHGDCWTNNLLFRYDEMNNEPVEVVLVDLQLIREHCPTLDLNYLIYTSTTASFRKAHIDETLALYHEEFCKNCDDFNVEPFPEFTLDELKRRYHRSKIFGYFMAMMALPLMLKDGTTAVDLDKVVMSNNADVFSSIITDAPIDNGLYSQRLLDIAQELYDDGVI